MKKYRFSHLVVTLALAAALGSCRKDTLMLFEKSPDIYFSEMIRDPKVGIQSLSMKFNLFSVNDSILRIPVAVTGALASYDREISAIALSRDNGYGVTIGEEVLLAEAGVHYEILPSYIPAGQPNGYLNIRTIRAESNEDKREHALFLELQPNAHFGTNFKWYMYNTSEKLKTYVLNYPIYISDTLSMPSFWEKTYTLGYWGTYSATKYRLICTLTGLAPGYWEGVVVVAGRTVDAADIPPAGSMLRAYLYEQFMLGKPVMDEDEELMTVPGFFEMIQ